MKKLLGIIILLIGVCAIITWKAGGDLFFGSENLQNLSRQIALLGIFAIGEGIVIISGGIDLSIGSVMAFSGVFFTSAVMSDHMNPFVAGAIVIGMGMVIGLWHGFLVTRLKLLPFMATLCTFLILRGHARVLSNDTTVGFESAHAGIRALGNGFCMGIPTPVVILAVIALIASFFMHFTVYGRYLYAIGRNPEAAEYSGVKVARMQTAAYVVCGALTALSGILYASYTNSVQPATTGQAYELWAVAAAVIGGCSLNGGQGTIIGIVIGSAIMRVMQNGINLLGIVSAWEFAVLGYVVLIGVAGDSIYKMRGAKRVKPHAKLAPACETNTDKDAKVEAPKS